MSAGDYPVVMCDDDSGCTEWALDHTLHGLGKLVGSETQLPDGWTGDAPGAGQDEQFCPMHPRVIPSAPRCCSACRTQGWACSASCGRACCVAEATARVIPPGSSDT